MLLSVSASVYSVRKPSRQCRSQLPSRAGCATAAHEISASAAIDQRGRALSRTLIGPLLRLGGAASLEVVEERDVRRNAVGVVGGKDAVDAPRLDRDRNRASHGGGGGRVLQHEIEVAGRQRYLLASAGRRDARERQAGRDVCPLRNDVERD